MGSKTLMKACNTKNNHLIKSLITDKRQLSKNDFMNALCAKYYCEFVNIVCKICKYYLFLCYNISDAPKIYIFWGKLRNFS